MWRCDGGGGGGKRRCGTGVRWRREEGIGVGLRGEGGQGRWDVEVGLRRGEGWGAEEENQAKPLSVIPHTSGAREGTEGSSIPRGSKHASNGERKGWNSACKPRTLFQCHYY